MKVSTSLSALAALALTSAAATPIGARRIPTSRESAVLGRRVLALSPLGTLTTVFPNETDDRHRPAGLGGVPVGLVDYIADCEDEGSPTVLAINIATAFKNVAAGSNISVGVNWVPPFPPDRRIESSGRRAGSWLSSYNPFAKPLAATTDSVPDSYDPVPYSAANLPRFSLFGYLEPIEAKSGGRADQDLAQCFVAAHPDARYWLPGNPIHESSWARVVVTAVYWLGGFGDRAYIGWISADEWKSVTRAEWEAVRLPGEKKGWKEWSVGREQGEYDL